MVTVPAGAPQVSVVVFVREVSNTLDATLRSLEQQKGFDDVEVIVADGSPAGMEEWLREDFPWSRHVPLPGANMPALKGQAIRQSRGEIVAILDSVDMAEPGWIEEILAGFEDEAVSAIGGAVVLDGPPTAANRAAYLFEYGAFSPPVPSGPTNGDLPGNNVAYRRRVLVETCAEVLHDEGFYKPWVHQQIRSSGGSLVIRPSMRVRHLTSHRFLAFAVRRLHYGRCFGASRRRRSPLRLQLLYTIFAPAVVPLLMFRHVARALRHPANRRLLPHAGIGLLGVCLFWGVGEWLGCWFGPGRSCEKLY